MTQDQKDARLLHGIIFGAEVEAAPKPAHTPGRWCSNGYAEIMGGPEPLSEDSLVAIAYAPRAREDLGARCANAAHIVACVNACEGLNPEGVRELVEAASNAIDLRDADQSLREPAMRRLMQALAKARGA